MYISNELQRCCLEHVSIVGVMSPTKCGNCGRRMVVKDKTWVWEEITDRELIINAALETASQIEETLSYTKDHAVFEAATTTIAAFRVFADQLKKG
jgi:hypothetical protein